MAIKVTCPQCFEQFMTVPEPDKDCTCPTCGAEVPKPDDNCSYLRGAKPKVKRRERESDSQQWSHNDDT
jgi:ribosomal protein S27E